jgi:hypothetical protein
VPWQSYIPFFGVSVAVKYFLIKFDERCLLTCGIFHISAAETAVHHQYGSYQKAPNKTGDLNSTVGFDLETEKAAMASALI